MRQSLRRYKKSATALTWAWVPLRTTQSALGLEWVLEGVSPLSPCRPSLAPPTMCHFLRQPFQSSCSFWKKVRDTQFTDTQDTQLLSCPCVALDLLSCSNSITNTHTHTHTFRAASVSVWQSYTGECSASYSSIGMWFIAVSNGFVSPRPAPEEACSGADPQTTINRPPETVCKGKERLLRQYHALCTVYMYYVYTN